MAGPAIVGPLPRSARAMANSAHGFLERPGSLQSEGLIIGAYQSAGVRVFDVSSAPKSKEAGYFVPDAPEKVADGRLAGCRTRGPVARRLCGSRRTLFIADTHGGLTVTPFRV
jgi:hypothetical protein